MHALILPLHALCSILHNVFFLCFLFYMSECVYVFINQTVQILIKIDIIRRTMIYSTQWKNCSHQPAAAEAEAKGSFLFLFLLSTIFQQEICLWIFFYYHPKIA